MTEPCPEVWAGDGLWQLHGLGALPRSCSRLWRRRPPAVVTVGLLFFGVSPAPSPPRRPRLVSWRERLFPSGRRGWASPVSSTLEPPRAPARPEAQLRTCVAGRALTAPRPHPTADPAPPTTFLAHPGQRRPAGGSSLCPLLRPQPASDAPWPSEPSGIRPLLPPHPPWPQPPYRHTRSVCRGRGGAVWWGDGPPVHLVSLTCDARPVGMTPGGGVQECGAHTPPALAQPTGEALPSRSP